MKKIAQKGSIIIFSLIIVFHLLVIFQSIPFTVIGGGRVKTLSEMYQLEIPALILNILFLIIVLLKIKKSHLKPLNYILKVLLWLMAFFFVLNTIGNLLSANTFEMLVFTPLTIALAVFCVVLALDKLKN